MCATADPRGNGSPDSPVVYPRRGREHHPAKRPDGTYADPGKLAARMLAADRALRRLERYHRLNGELGYANAVLSARDQLAGRLAPKAMPR